MEAIFARLPEDLEIWEIQNDGGITLLHQAAIKNQPVIFRKLLKLAKEKIENGGNKYQNKNIIQNWVNKQTHDESFTAIHYASFNGNIEICQMLIEEGADKHVQNRHGLNSLHIAA